MLEHKQWLDNEYGLWVKALQESTIHNFKEHPMVKRMLGDTPMEDGYILYNGGPEVPVLHKIYMIGYTEKSRPFNYEFERTVKYAYEILKRNPSSICEIGGGVGQFYAILRALGYKGKYWIEDLLEVKHFQNQYLYEVSKQTGLNTEQILTTDCEIVVSFYALGEFDDQRKKRYFDLAINKCDHGYIAWNPHSGASDDLSLFKHDIKVTPGIEPGIKIIEW